MGSTTEFHGKFDLDRALSPAHAAYLRAFAGSRRMKRNEHVTVLMLDPVRLAVELPVGPQGAYYVGAASHNHGQVHTPDIVEYNYPPRGQPGLWCQWIPTKDGAGIEWNNWEKFYDYIEWIEYLIEHFLRPWGYVLNGTVQWQGEDDEDTGSIIIENNDVTVVRD